LWATVHFILNVKPAQHLEGKLSDQTPARLRRPASHGRGGMAAGQPCSNSQVTRRRPPFFAKRLARHSEWNCPILTRPAVPL
jgi:hypothetical protein